VKQTVCFVIDEFFVRRLEAHVYAGALNRKYDYLNLFGVQSEESISVIQFQGLVRTLRKHLLFGLDSVRIFVQF
jgi:hypothetical protein